MIYSHEPWLVALSLVMAFQGSYVGLHLARKIGDSQGIRRRTIITMSALSIALAIWTMHFVGMLALRLPVAVDFLVLPTLLSFLICVLVVGLAVFVVGTGSPTPQRIGFASLLMGAGIVSMHYMGMYALHSSINMAHAPFLIIASIAVGVAASGLSLWLGFGGGTWRSTLVSAVLMALAISAMHYTAMAGFDILSLCEPGKAANAPVMSQNLLAIVMSVVAFVVSGLFLLTLVPEGAATVASGLKSASTGVATSQVAGSQVSTAPVSEIAILGTNVARRTPHQSLPVERAGKRSTLAVERVVAVQAQAHYTMLFDGEANWFCPLSISEVEALLDTATFARVHRSHIVNLDRLTFVGRSREGGFFETATGVPHKVPVSRTRRGWLKQQLQQRAALAAGP